MMIITSFSQRSLLIEMIVLFVCIPVLLVLPTAIPIKIFFVISGFVYTLFVLYQLTKFKIQKTSQKNRSSFLTSILLRILLVIIFGVIIVLYQSPETFLRIIVEDTRLWVLIVFVYSIGSVIPQEILYRSFFFHRYQDLFKSKNSLMIINGLLFGISHAFLGSWIIVFATTIGGIMFARTYIKTQSTVLVSIEHALYGLILFTIGIGPLLAFPA